MHPTALQTGRLFFETYWQSNYHNILDIGSRDVNGSLRSVKPEAAAYLGVDLQPGPGVELVLQDPHHLPLDDQSVDIVVSTSCLEHDPLFWLTFGEMLRVLKPGGILYINAPSNGGYHGYPFDHWRFYPDAGRALVQWAERLERPVTLIESFIGECAGGTWANNVMVFACEPFDYALPERLLCDQLMGATNVRRGNAEELERFEALPEDLRRLKQANARINALEAQLKEYEANASVRMKELAYLKKNTAKLPLQEADQGSRGDNFNTAFSAPFLQGYQSGVMSYSYRGVSCLKSPIDLAIYAKAIWKLRPATLIEIGSKAGGSALWFADLLHNYGLEALVYSIDLHPPQNIVAERIQFLQGDANDLQSVFSDYGLIDAPHPWLVIEDSAHTYQTCSAALAQLASLMQSGDLLVMEDGVLDDLGLSERYNGGPNRALQEFFIQHPETFIVDHQLCDLFGKNATYSPNGWLWKT